MNDETVRSAPRGRRLLLRLFTLALISVLAVLLFNLIRHVDWREVWQALRGFSLATLALGVALVLVSHLLFSAFDLLGRAYTGHHLPTRQVLRVAFVCYAFNLNLGSWVGSVAMRYRLYSRLGLDLSTITRILSTSIITNWLGYILMAGLVFTLGLLELPEHWRLGSEGLRIVGVLLLLAGAAYLLACRFATHRTWHWRAHRITLPSLRFALLQAGMGALNWCLMALLITLLLPERAGFATVLGILLISAIAGVVTHIPAGLGVLEAIFLAMLQHQMPASALLAALIGYRALYFLLPLLVACVLYLVLERRAGRRRDISAA
jgi:uncharacterized membrane protein YbhN (UPF0104 family)